MCKSIYQLIWKSSLIVMLLSFFSETSYAQVKFGGQIFENNTKIPLSGISVENLNTHLKQISASDGSFAINAKIGDLLSFSSPYYQPDTIYIINLNYLKIYLNLKAKVLNEVKVTSSEIKAGSLKAAPSKGPFNSETVLYQTDAAGRPIGGIKIMVHDWNKNENRRRREQQFLLDEEKKVQIAKVFSPENIQNYLPIRNQELKNFITLYIPDIKTYNSHGFNLLDYLTSSYKDFLKIPAEQRQSEDFLMINK
ncbi:hypothetical protein [Mucilaginibacter sp. NFX135]|uniref:hypothetical protein n=1 Tax=Mucilaginibacter sp. NFX135 TaxID=3402687 RepID=UPI003AFB55DD